MKGLSEKGVYLWIWGRATGGRFFGETKIHLFLEPVDARDGDANLLACVENAPMPTARQPPSGGIELIEIVVQGRNADEARKQELG